MHTSILTKRSIRAVLRGVSLITVFSTVLLSFPPRITNAAGALTTAYMRMSRQQGDVASAATFTVFWTPTSTATEAKLVVTFPDADDGKWCRTEGDLTLATTTIDSASNPTASAGTCTKGSGASSYDKFTFTTADLSPATLYGTVISADTAVLGTGAAGLHLVTVQTQTGAAAEIDTLTIALRTIADDQVDVTATIDPSLTVTLGTTTSVDLGTLTTAQVNQASMTSEVTTNAPNGYVSTVMYNNTLTAPGPYTIAAETGGGTIAKGTSEFGASTSDTGTELAVTSNSCTSADQTMNATALSASVAKSFALATGPVAAESTTLCFVAAISGTQQPGSYTSTVTLVTTAKF